MKQNTSWQEAGRWYDDIVGDKGHYYHQHVIIPKLQTLIPEKSIDSLIDIGCGEGVLSRYLPPHTRYLGLDLASTLIKSAEIKNKNRQFRFAVHDATRPFPLKPAEQFSHAVALLSIQNMSDARAVFCNVHKALSENGLFVMVLNHPCFRIPRQSSWGFDEKCKLQYRKVNSYMSENKIPIQTHPGKEKSSTTYSFHLPLSTYSRYLQEAGFTIELIDEWCSDKQSTGAAAAQENRARKEFPLFLTLLSRKK